MFASYSEVYGGHNPAYSITPRFVTNNREAKGRTRDTTTSTLRVHETSKVW
jgi:hypothetical protein